ncbi:hypothetical protein LCGC14_3061270 [marine sediment metagenome]|uniref:Uncharacterized protein n=1 Tax=marine sediment metagenome TaxID=412755 RepID=A0A0F8WIR3_9ZZZZ
MSEKLKTAQDVINTTNSSVMAGFNMFVLGYESPFKSYPRYYDLAERSRGYDYAENMARDGKLAFTHRFNCSCGHLPFMYGGFWVCNGCGRSGVDNEWWKIKVEKDGDAYCCHGLDFINLQESDNYEFGKSFKEAINKYGEKMKSSPTGGGE